MSKPVTYHTRFEDIEKELENYKEHFKNKIIFAKGEGSFQSNFYKYFKKNFEVLGLKKLITSNTSSSNNSFKVELSYVGGNIEEIKTPITSNNFESKEIVKLLQEADIVCPNPTFKSFIDYFDQLMKYEKRFFILCDWSKLDNNKMVELIRNQQIWVGFNNVPKSIVIDSSGVEKLKETPTIWITNLDSSKNKSFIPITKEYNVKNYPNKYTNYNSIIDVPKVKLIPKNYKEEMVVPISFLKKYNPNQFEIIGQGIGLDGKKLLLNNETRKRLKIIIRHKSSKPKSTNLNSSFYFLNNNIDEEFAKFNETNTNDPGGYILGYVKLRKNHTKWAKNLKDKHRICAVCGVSQRSLLIASHILPWSKSEGNEKTDPHNGIVLCVLHDKLFELDYISFDNKGYLKCLNVIKEYDQFYNVSKDKLETLSNNNLKLLSASEYDLEKINEYIEKKFKGNIWNNVVK